MQSLEGRVAFVTGAGSGIGRAAACRLAAAGAKVGVVELREADAEETIREIQQAGGEATCLECDIAQPDQVKAAADRLAEVYGRIDIVFANAGINGTWAPLDELTVDEWNQVMAINLSGTFFTLKFTAPYLCKQGGSVIVTASVNGTRMFSNTGATAYATTKAGQVALTKMLALELAPHDVRVNVICPGAIKTHIDERTNRKDLDKVRYPAEYPEGEVPLTHGKPGTADEVADLVWFLASDCSRHISGTEVWIDGTESLFRG